MGQAGRRGLVIGFDLAVDDEDTPGKGRKLQMVWAGTRTNFRDPRAYGQLLLRQAEGPRVAMLGQSGLSVPNRNALVWYGRWRSWCVAISAVAAFVGRGRSPQRGHTT